MGRIIAGLARGTQLRAPAGNRTRPTTDRVREALFSTLAAWAGGAERPPSDQLTGIRFLDLYAGSGAIGLEAASRGATEAVLIEKNRVAIEAIQRNLAATKLGDRVRLQPMSVGSFLATEPRPFDVIWLDPPYAAPADEVDAVLAQICEGWLVSDGLVVIERSKRDPDPDWPASLPEQWTRRYGETQLHFGRPAAQQPEGDQ